MQRLAQSNLFGWNVRIVGCELRAHIGAFVMQTKKFSIEFDTDFTGCVFQIVLIASNLLLSLPDSNKKVAIDTHVATAVKLGEETMVLDPLFDKEHALSSSEWAARLDSKITNIDCCFLNGDVRKLPKKRENASIQFIAHNSMLKMQARREGPRINGANLLMDLDEVHEQEIRSMILKVKQINNDTDRVKVAAAMLFYSAAIDFVIKSQNDDISRLSDFLQLIGHPHLPTILEAVGYYRRAGELLKDFTRTRSVPLI